MGYCYNAIAKDYSTFCLVLWIPFPITINYLLTSGHCSNITAHKDIARECHWSLITCVFAHFVIGNTGSGSIQICRPKLRRFDDFSYGHIRFWHWRYAEECYVNNRVKAHEIQIIINICLWTKIWRNQIDLSTAVPTYLWRTMRHGL